MGTVGNECTLSKRFSEIVFHSEQQRAGELETNHNQYMPYLTAVNAVIIVSGMKLHYPPRILFFAKQLSVRQNGH